MHDMIVKSFLIEEYMMFLRFHLARNPNAESQAQLRLPHDSSGAALRPWTPSQSLAISVSQFQCCPEKEVSWMAWPYWFEMFRMLLAGAGDLNN